MKNKNLSVTGSLALELNDLPLEFQASHDRIKIVFDSVKAFKEAFTFFRYLQQEITIPLTISHDLTDNLTIFYFIKEKLIAESGPNIVATWYSSYLGVKNLKIHSYALIKAFIFN